jgi:hypothetical protein
LAKLKLGTQVRCKITKQRNPLFHRKFFALLNVGFKYWVPGEISSKYGTPEKNFDQYRADVTILAGYFDVAIRLDGSTRVTPKSISFGSMEQDEFEKLYSAVIDVLLKHIFVGYTSDDVVKMAEQDILNFA